jgi:GT2 family glycosyltransferase
VSVVIPYFEAPRQLDLTLAALTQQTYPIDMLEVIVADDGSRPEMAAAVTDGPLRSKVVYQERRGFGAPRARNLGASHASGDLLVLLDCDMVPEREHIEAHARWHHALDYAVVFGFRRHVDFEGITPTDILQASSSGGLVQLFEGRPSHGVDWIERHLARTDSLRQSVSDLWRLTSSGNLSLHRDLYWRVGGFDESFNQWGGEDNEFGYRLSASGAVIVPEPAAFAWHQGEGHEPSPSELHSLEEQRPKLASLIPDPTIRRIKTGRTYDVPVVTVHVSAHEGTKEQTLSVVESILAGRFSDLIVFVDVQPDSPDLVWMIRQFQSDSRVRVGSGLDPLGEVPAAAIRVEIPNTVLFSIGTLENIVGVLWNDNVGALHITHPDRERPIDLIEAYTTRAWNRAERLTSEPSARSAVIGRLFGERWISGLSHGFLAADEFGTPRGENSWLSEIAARDEQIRLLTGRRSLRISDAVGALLRAKSRQELGAAARGFAAAMRKQTDA